MNEAALLATREDKDKVSTWPTSTLPLPGQGPDGAKTRGVITDKVKRMTAYHEIGHALVAWLLPLANPVHKVTIIPRGRTLGVTQFLPTDEDTVSISHSEAQAQLAMVLGGRAAERLIYEEQTAGDAGDLKSATRLARAMVTQWGMSDRIGPVFFRDGEEHQGPRRAMTEVGRPPEHTAQLIDEEVSRILREADERPSRLEEHRG